MAFPLDIHSRALIVLIISVLVAASACWLDVKADDLCTREVKWTNVNGEHLQSSVTDEHALSACVDTARTGLCLGAVLCSAAVVAWLFAPVSRSLSVESQTALAPSVSMETVTS